MSIIKCKPKVGLFATCLVDLMRPSIGFAAVKLLENAGCEVSVPSQTCCGQPAYNSGDRASTKAIALQVIKAFEGVEYVVAPSGSCGGMIAKHYPELFADDPNMRSAAQAFSDKCYELISFLTDVMFVTSVDASYTAIATYHDSCSGLRELGVQSQPRKLLASVKGLTLKEMAENDVCCGFGGTFAVKYSEISDSIVSKKTENITNSGAELLLAGDLGCLMNMAGKLSRQGSNVQVRHIAEILAGMSDLPPIGAARGDKKQ